MLEPGPHSQAGGSPEVVGTMLAARAVAGDGEAIAELWRAHRRWVAAVILAHKPREADVEDLLQDVAMTFVRSINQLRDQATLKPWLRTVAINAALAAGRRETRRREGVTWKLGSELIAGGSTGAGEEPSGGDPRASAERLAQREQSADLIELAAELPDGYREPLILKCVRNMSYREIGAMMDLPETTVETRIARGRRMLRELIEKREQAARAGPGTQSEAQPKGPGARAGVMT